MKTFLIIFFISIISYSTYSQNLRTINIPRGARTESTVIVGGVATHSYSSGKKIPINGTAFLDKAFKKGVIELRDGRISEDILLRYNIAIDAFEIAANNDTLSVNRPYQIEKIFLDDRVFIFDPKLRSNVERKYNGFFELAIDDNLSLYVKRMKNMSYDSFAPNYQGGSGTKEYYYVDKVSYVGQFKNEKPFLISSTKSLIRNLDKNKSEVKDYIKKNRLKLKKLDDLMKVVGYYNSL